MCCGRTPRETFDDGMRITKEKLIGDAAFGDGHGGARHRSQRGGKDGAANAEAVLGVGRRDLRQPSVVEQPAVGRVLVPVERLLVGEGDPVGLLRKRGDGGTRRPAGRGPCRDWVQGIVATPRCVTEHS